MLLLGAMAPRASAQTLRVAVLPVEGPQGDKATREILKAVQRKVQLVPDAEWSSSARKLFASSRAPSDLAAVAGDLGVQVVITGKVKKTVQGWELSVGVRHGPTGRSAVKLRYPLKGPRLDGATLRRLGGDVVPALDTAALGPAGAEAPESPEQAPTPEEMAPGVPGVEDENPLEPEPTPEELAAATRPSWAPWVEGSVGFVLGGRSFGFDESNTPNFKAAVSPGLQVDATAYPLAFLASRYAGAARNALAGLGAGGTFGTTFWGDSIPCYPDASGKCLPTVDHFGTSEYRLEAGLRWRWNVLRRTELSPELLARLQYGQHAFSVQKRAYLADGAPRDIGPPDVDYRYIVIGVGSRMAFARRFSAQLDFDWHVLVDTGPIQTRAEWGPGAAFGFRASGHVDGRIWRGLFARIGAYVEYYGLSFDQPPAVHNTMPPCPCGTISNATDTFYGGDVSVGYRY